MADEPRFRHAATGLQRPFDAVAFGPESAVGWYLTDREAVLADGTRLRQHRAVPGKDRLAGYAGLDNEILAGRLLSNLGPGGCPPEVSCLFGDDDGTAVEDPYALFEPYRGEPLSRVGADLVAQERAQFRVSLLRGLCWLAGAGLAHRSLNLDTVWWDGDSGTALITDFSLSTVFGAPRTPTPGPAGWVPKDLRQSTFVDGPVGERDDIWAAGRLIFYVWNQGADLDRLEDLARGGLDTLLGDVFSRPEARPTASELLALLKAPNPAPSWGDTSAQWRRERAQFLAARRALHPEAADPPDFCADLGYRDRTDRPDRPAGPPAGRVPAPAGAPDDQGPPARAARNRSWPSQPPIVTPPEPPRRRPRWRRGAS